MALATEPLAGDTALELALRALTRFVCARHAPPEGARDAEGEAPQALRRALAQATLWLTLEQALLGERDALDLFPSLLNLRELRREELLCDVRSLRRALDAWHVQPSPPATASGSRPSAPDEDIAMTLTKAAHASGLHALASWVCGADALDELELVLTGLLASSGGLVAKPALPSGQLSMFAALLARGARHWGETSAPAGASFAPAALRVPMPPTALPNGTLASPSHNEARRAPSPGLLFLSTGLGSLLFGLLALTMWLRQATPSESPAGPAAAPSSTRAEAPRTSAAEEPASRPSAATPHVRLYSRPTRAQLYLDGRYVGLTPLELPRDRAIGTLTLSLDGYPELRQQIDLRDSTNSVMVFDLHAPAAPPTAPDRAPAAP